MCEHCRKPHPEPDSPEGRAASLLDAALTPRQRTDLRAYGCFTVVGPSGLAYRLMRPDPAGHFGWDEGLPGGVNVFSSNGIRFCTFARHGVPSDDFLLAQKLLIETNESAFLATADRS